MSHEKSLKDQDPEIYEIIEKEKKRQFLGLELIASENFVSKSVLEALGSCLTNKYSEGQVGHRYYGGNENIDEIEFLAIKRALKAFRLDEKVWAVNCQPYSGSPANFAVYTAILKPHDRFMGLDLPSGGHLTHGYYSEKKKISATSIYFESLPYHVDKNGYIDFEELEKSAKNFQPKLIICGGSAYPRDWDYARFRKIADSCGAYLMCDMAHFSGLVAAGEHNDPFQYCDVVTTTTHKSLKGPRSAMIFSKKIPLKDNKEVTIDKAVDFAVFPGLQGGPHNHQIAAVAVQLKEVCSDEFKEYAKQVKKNAKALAQALMDKGHKLMTDGTENHLVLWNLTGHKLTGSKMEKACEVASLTVNKNSVAGDLSPLSPNGIRLGTPALTSRGFKEKDFEQVAEFLDKVVKISLKIQEKTGPKLVDFVKELPNSEELKELKNEVEKFAKKFPMPGFDVDLKEEK